MKTNIDTALNRYTALVVLALLSVVAALLLWFKMPPYIAVIILVSVIIVASLPCKADAKLLLCLVLLGLVSTVSMLKYGFEMSTLEAITIAIIVAPVMAFNLIPRMSYSLEADLSLKRFIKDLRIELVAENQGILEIEGVWGYDWPKVVILFESKQALEEAETNGLLKQLAYRITDAVNSDPSYGPNRKWFDSKEAVWGMTEGSAWDNLVAKRSFP